MKIYIYIGVMAFLCACSHPNKMTFTPPQNEVVCNLESHIINSSLMMSIARDIKVYNDYLIVRTFSDNKYLYILNKNTGEVITGIVSQGNGANEITDMSDQIQVDNKGNLFWFDYTKKKQYKCNIDSCINSVDDYTTTDFGIYDGNIDLALNLDGGYLLSLGDRYSESNKIKRYAIFDAQGIKKYYSGFPIIEGDTRNLNDIYLNYRASQHIALSPDHHKFAVAEIYGGILEIFHLNDSITLNSIHPLYASKEKELQGFVDLCATDSFIYAIKIDSNLDGTNMKNRYNKIMVFDWEGKYIKTYQSDYNLLTLDVDETTGHIYAVGQSIELDSELQILSFALSR